MPDGSAPIIPALEELAARCRPAGIYFALPEADYHADPSFSASGIKDITVSPLDYWAKSAMNPMREEDTRSDAKDLGKAYHKLILEGPEAFKATYAVSVDRADYPDAIGDAAELRAWLKDQGAKQSGTIPEMTERAKEIDPTIQVWPAIRDEWKEANAAKESIAPKQWRGLMLAQRVLEMTPAVSDAFTGGRPEVSIFWRTDRGVPMKARLDYWKPGRILDLKTFANQMSKPVIAAVSREVAAHRYYIQPFVYVQAVVRAAQMWNAHGYDVVHGDDPPHHLLQSLTSDPPEFWFVFVQTGGVPNIVPRQWRQFETFGGQGATTNEYWRTGKIAVEHGLSLFERCIAQYGSDPWLIDAGAKAFVDQDFPIWMMTEAV